MNGLAMDYLAELDDFCIECGEHVDHCHCYIEIELCEEDIQC